MWYYRNRKQKCESKLISNCIDVCSKEEDIEASSLSLQYRYDTMRHRRGIDLIVVCGKLRVSLSPSFSLSQSIISVCQTSLLCYRLFDKCEPWSGLADCRRSDQNTTDRSNCRTHQWLRCTGSLSGHRCCISAASGEWNTWVQYG